MATRIRTAIPMLAMASSRSFGSVMGLLTSFVLCRWVAPVDMGKWNRASLIFFYLQFLRLGTSHGLSRELAVATGQQDTSRQKDLVSASLGWVLLMAGLCGFVLLAEGAISFLSEGSLFDTAIRIAIVMGGVQLLVTHYSVTYRTSAHFVRLSHTVMISIVVGAVLLLLVMAYGYHGLLARFLMLELVSLGLKILWTPYRIGPKWDFGTLKELIRVGFPIMAVTQVEMWLGTLDRLALLTNKEALGFLTLSLLVRRSYEALASAISLVDFAKLAELHGAGNGIARLRQQSNMTISILMSGSAFIAALAWFGLPPVVHLFMPDYTPGVDAARWMCLYGIAWAPAFAGNILKVTRRQGYLYFACGVHLASFLTARFVLASWDDPLLATTKALVAARCCSSLFTFVATRYSRGTPVVLKLAGRQDVVL